MSTRLAQSEPHLIKLLWYNVLSFLLWYNICMRDNVCWRYPVPNAQDSLKIRLQLRHCLTWARLEPKFNCLRHWFTWAISSQSSIAFHLVMNCVRPNGQRQRHKHNARQVIHTSPEITLTSGKRLLEPHVACAKPKTSCDPHVTWDKRSLEANVYLSHTSLVQNQRGWN